MMVFRARIGIDMTNGHVRQSGAHFRLVPCPRQIFLSKDFGSGAIGNDLACQQQGFGVLIPHMLEIMQNTDYGPPFTAPEPNQGGQIGHCIGIDRAIGLIEQDQWRILQEHAREAGALQLSTRELSDWPRFKSSQADGADRGFDPLPCLSAETAKRAKLGPQAHRDKIMNNDGKAAVERRLLGQIGDFATLQADQVDSSLHWPEFTDDSLEQGRFSGAIGPDDGEQRTGSHLSRQMVHGRMPVVAEGQVLESQDRRTCRGHDMAQNTAAQRTIKAPKPQAKRDSTLWHKAGLMCSGFSLGWA